MKPRNLLVSNGLAATAEAAALAAAAALALVAILTARPSLAGPAVPAIEIKAREFVFVPKEITTRATDVVFVVKNEGAIEHNFVIEDANRKTVAQIPVIEVGKTEELKVTLRPGTYTIACTLPGHRDVGMLGTLRAQP